MKLTLVLLLITLACCSSSVSALCDLIDNLAKVVLYGSYSDVAQKLRNQSSLTKSGVLRLKDCVDQFSQAEKDGLKKLVETILNAC